MIELDTTKAPPNPGGWNKVEMNAGFTAALALYNRSDAYPIFCRHALLTILGARVNR